MSETNDEAKSATDPKDLGDGGSGDGAGSPADVKETPAEKFARLKGMTLRAAKDAGVSEEEIFSAPKKSSKKSEEKDYGQLAYLTANGIKGAEEVALAQEFVKNTGKDLDDIINNKFFQSELKELREAKATSDAVPGVAKRSGASATDTVDYWIAKGELPPNTPDNRKLRQEIVNRRMKAETSGNIFTNNPVVGK